MSTQGELFNSETKRVIRDPKRKSQGAAKEAKQEAIQRVEQNANPQFLAMCRVALEAVAREQEYFTTDPVWERYEQGSSHPFPHERRAIGPVMLRATKDGVITKAGDQHWNSTSARCHNRPKQVYQSLIYKREG